MPIILTKSMPLLTSSLSLEVPFWILIWLLSKLVPSTRLQLFLPKPVTLISPTTLWKLYFPSDVGTSAFAVMCGGHGGGYSRDDGFLAVQTIIFRNLLRLQPLPMSHPLPMTFSNLLLVPVTSLIHRRPPHLAVLNVIFANAMVTRLLIALIVSTCRMKVKFLHLVFRLMRLSFLLVHLQLHHLCNSGSLTPKPTLT